VNALAEVHAMPVQGRSLTAANVREHVNLIQEVMAAVMKKDTHYGVIPGCKLPSLYKAGSEVLLATFRIAVSVRVEDLSTPDCVRYRVSVIGTHQQSGIVVGEGIGECSSDEGKYRWRRCYLREEFEATPESRRRIKFVENKNGGKPYENMEVRTEPADVANTILKMAKKRAQIDMTLTATAASDIFTQDIEDLPEELRGEVGEGHRSSKPAAAQKASTPERDKIVADLYLIAEQGMEALTTAWGALTEEARKSVGAEFGAIKKKAAPK
jgi:hypothetical protein